MRKEKIDKNSIKEIVDDDIKFLRENSWYFHGNSKDNIKDEDLKEIKKSFFSRMNTMLDIRQTVSPYELEEDVVIDVSNIMMYFKSVFLLNYRGLEGRRLVSFIVLAFANVLSMYNRSIGLEGIWYKVFVVMSVSSFIGFNLYSIIILKLKDRIAVLDRKYNLWRL